MVNQVLTLSFGNKLNTEGKFYLHALLCWFTVLAGCSQELHVVVQVIAWSQKLQETINLPPLVFLELVKSAYDGRLTKDAVDYYNKTMKPKKSKGDAPAALPDMPALPDEPEDRRRFHIDVLFHYMNAHYRK